jgi:hypothetical protein
MRWMGSLLALGLLIAPAYAAQNAIQSPDGKTLALILDCNSCRRGKTGGDCKSGVEKGYHSSAACGQCLVVSNYGTRIPYGYDLQIFGHIKDKDGKPLSGKFVKLLLPNSWTMRTRTTADGMFRLMLGATADRKGGPIKVELGDRTMSADQTTDYLLYMMPPHYKPCEKSKK